MFNHVLQHLLRQNQTRMIHRLQNQPKHHHHLHLHLHQPDQSTNNQVAVNWLRQKYCNYTIFFMFEIDSLWFSIMLISINKRYLLVNIILFMIFAFPVWKEKQQTNQVFWTRQAFLHSFETCFDFKNGDIFLCQVQTKSNSNEF